MPVAQVSRNQGLPHPAVGDDQYWWHLLPLSAVESFRARPMQVALLDHSRRPIAMDFYHAWLVSFLRWIPTTAGTWDDLPDGRIYIDAAGAAVAKSIFRALAELFGAGPAVVEFPPLPVVTWQGGKPIASRRELVYPREQLLDTFSALADFAAATSQGDHCLFFSYWVDRPTD